MESVDWNKKHILKIGNVSQCGNDIISIAADAEDEEKAQQQLRAKIEPWLTALFQSEHLSLLVGAGLTSATTHMAGVQATNMDRVEFSDFGDKIKSIANTQAKEMDRGEANVEDDIRVSFELLRGLEILEENAEASILKNNIDELLLSFIKDILQTEEIFLQKIAADEHDATSALRTLKSFLISFASRTASRERLHIFTTNYDRFLEYAIDSAGILTLDRFLGKLNPVFRSSRLELDYHYNPPGIRGEPRYVEGVARLSKLHGSLDWRMESSIISKALLPFGAPSTHPEIPEQASEHVVIYPNASKGVETVFYPYSELFRDFSGAICRPNSVVVTYGYGFGDSHINRILQDMLTIPSTHLAIIAWDMEYSPGDFGGARERIKHFVERNNPAQFTLLLGQHFGDLNTLVSSYLPKAAIDRISRKAYQNTLHRGTTQNNTKEVVDDQQ